MLVPKLKNVRNVTEPYALGQFPEKFLHSVAGAISASIAIQRIDIEGKDWERIFAKAIGAEWSPSNIGLDDILMRNLSAAWGAKTIKHDKPFTAQKIRLISGRNSLNYSYDLSDPKSKTPEDLGQMILQIWNERVATLYKKYKTLRTVVLIKGPMLKQISIFEKDTIRYNPEEYKWEWNKRKNLEGRNQQGKIKFTWQPHGSQFTIHETVPDYTLNIEITPPTNITTEKILEDIGFNETYYHIVPRNKS